MGGHTNKNFLVAVTLLFYVTATLARGVREEFTHDDVRGDFGTLEITKDDASTTTTTTRKTPRDCEYNGRRYSDGSLVQTEESECKNCYCISGKVTCTKTKCDQHLEGCKPIMEEGRCCPVRYECDDKNDQIHADELLADFGTDIFGRIRPSVANQRDAFKDTEPDWQRNMARQSPGGETIITDTANGEISGVGHVEAISAHSFSEWSLQKPKRHFNTDKVVEVGTGVNVKGDLRDAVAFGPILISENSVRVDRQNREFNTTDDSETTDSENTAATEIPEETTMLSLDEVNDTDHATANGESSIDYETGTDEITTLFPTLPLAKVTTVKSLSELLSQATTEPTTTTESLSSVSDNVEYIAADDLEGIETDFPSYDITVGTSVLATNQAKPFTPGVGEVIPVDLEPEHKSPEIESGPVIQDESPSLLGTILNILTRTERPRPERFSPQPSSERLPLPPPPPPPGRLPPPPPPPFRPPFRPRPRPDGRPERRPDFIPPRFRPPPPPTKDIDRDTTEEPETSTDLSSPIPIVVPTTSQSDITAPKLESTNVNRPVAGFNKPSPVVNIPIHILNSEDENTRSDLPTGHTDEVHTRPNLANRPDFLPNRPIAIPPRGTSSNSAAGLPSKPVIEGGFQGMKDNEGFEPDFDYEYDEYGTPTLPPSLPNLKIIPFVAADALVNQEIGIAGDDFKSPILLKDTSADNEDSENQRIPETTEATTTTTRRSFLRLPIGERRPPILPPRRPINRPGDDTTTRRPFVPFRRPGERPTRAPFPFKTKTTASPEDENEDSIGTSPRPSIPSEDRERSSTRPPFIPPRRPTQVTEETTTTIIVPTTAQHLQSTTATTTTTTTSTTTTTTPRPIVSNDITNLLLQDVFGLTDTQNTPPVRFTQDRTTPKPRFPIKLTTSLPEIPAAVRDQMPLATDPVLASGLLKLSGCNIYGRMYDVGEQITELSSGCKECRCTHVGVQCLPAC